MATGFTSLACCASRRVDGEPLSAITSTGIGVRLHRTIGRASMQSVDPFITLIEFCAVPPFGCPERPMCGLETVTILLGGRWKHEDCEGHRGALNPGDVQRLYAGRGIVQCESSDGEEAARGLSIWLNVRSSDKRGAPTYQTVASRSISKIERKGVKLGVIAGEAFNRRGPVKTKSPTLLVSIRLDIDTSCELEVPPMWNGCVYVIEGRALVGPSDSQSIGETRQLLMLTSEEGLVRIENGCDERETHVLLLAGQPIKEPIERRGPFAMTSAAELEEAIEDFRQSRNGFVKAKNWRSSFSAQ